MEIPASLTDTASRVSIIENVNLRPWEPVAPKVKPYRQHEYVAGWDYQITPGWRSKLVMIAAVWTTSSKTRRSLTDWGEIFAIVNPGQGVNSTIDGYASYLASLGEAFGFPGTIINDPTVRMTSVPAPAVLKTPRQSATMTASNFA